MLANTQYKYVWRVAFLQLYMLHCASDDFWIDFDDLFEIVA